MRIARPNNTPYINDWGQSKITATDTKRGELLRDNFTLTRMALTKARHPREGGDPLVR